MSDYKDPSEMTNFAYLLDLSERLMHVPVVYGVDGYDIDRLREIAYEIRGMGAP